MIANYSDPIVTLNQVYKASAAGTVPTLGACVIGPHYIVRKYEDFGEALRLDSADNYPASEYNTVYTEAEGLTVRPYPARAGSDNIVDHVSKYGAKVLVRDAELEFRAYNGSDSVATVFELSDGDDTLTVKLNGTKVVFKDPYAEVTAVPVLEGDVAKVTLDDSDSSVVSCTVIGFLKDSNGKYTKCVLSKTFPAGASIAEVKFYKVMNCYVSADSITAGDKNITVAAGAESEELDLLGNGEAVKYPIAAGAFYAEYRVRSDKFTKIYGQVADVDYVADLLGKVCPENPLGIAVANAVEESEGNFVYFVALESDPEETDAMVEAYSKALDLIADKDGIYGIVPCTDNKEVTAALLQFVEKQSQEEIPYFKYLYASKEIPTEELVLPANGISLSVASVAYEASNSLTRVTFTGSPLLQVGTIVRGDIFRYSGGYEAVIDSSNHKNIIWLQGNYSATLDASDVVEIYKTLSDNADIIESIIAWKDIANKRCSFAIADGAMYNSTMAVPNYCVAAALAGKRSGTYPHAPLSNVAMKAITTTEAHGFTASQSRKLGAAGFWRVGMREDGTCISRRQLTSVASGDVNYDEQSIVCDIDSIGLSLKVTGRDLVGNTNISPVMIDLLESTLNYKLDKFMEYVDDYIGPQLISGSVISIKQD
jgi:hypothetical protein